MSNRLSPFLAATCIATFLAGCAQTLDRSASLDSNAVRPVLTPLMVEGRCTLVVSGGITGTSEPLGQVSLEVYEGIAQINVVASKADAHSSSTFHLVVPIEEQHVDVIYVGQPRHAIWERAAGGKACPT